MSTCVRVPQRLYTMETKDSVCVRYVNQNAGARCAMAGLLQALDRVARCSACDQTSRLYITDGVHMDPKLHSTTAAVKLFHHHRQRHRVNPSDLI